MRTSSSSPRRRSVIAAISASSACSCSVSTSSPLFAARWLRAPRIAILPGLPCPSCSEFLYWIKAARLRGPRALAARGRRPLLSAAPLSGAPGHSARHPGSAAHQAQSAAGTAASVHPADRIGCSEAGVRPGPHARPGGCRAAATQGGLHGQPSADCVHRCCARRNGQRRRRGGRAGGMSALDSGSMWSAAVLPPSRMRPREQTCCPGRGGRGAAAAARWFRPSWPLRVGSRIAVAGQRVVDASRVASVEPTSPCVHRTCTTSFFTWTHLGRGSAEASTTTTPVPSAPGS